MPDVDKVPFQTIHGLMLADHATQTLPERIDWGAVLDRWNEISTASETSAYTGIDNGDVLICAGVIASWPGRAQIWGLVSNGITRGQMVCIHRQALEWLDQLQESDSYRRLETTARLDQPQALRWLEMLGFECEGRLRCYDADGNDHKLYSRISCHSTPPKSPP